MIWWAWLVPAFILGMLAGYLLHIAVAKVEGYYRRDTTGLRACTVLNIVNACGC